MPVCTVIREKRKALGLTQEQMADRLGVSAPAVNKWERGVTSPDIAILPALARLLETDINTLLCFEEDLSDEEIALFCNDVARIMKEDGTEAAFDAAEKKVREYPRCGKLLRMTAAIVQGMTMMSGSYQTNEKYEKRYFPGMNALCTAETKRQKTPLRICLPENI